MEWDRKKEMNQLGTAIGQTPQARENFNQFVLSNVKDFDKLSWSIFFEYVLITQSSFERDYPFWKEMRGKVKELHSVTFGIRTGIRIAATNVLLNDMEWS